MHQYQIVGSYSLEEQQASSQYLTQSSTLARYVTIKMCIMYDISIKVEESSKSQEDLPLTDFIILTLSFLCPIIPTAPDYLYVSTYNCRPLTL